MPTDIFGFNTVFQEELFWNTCVKEELLGHKELCIILSPLRIWLWFNLHGEAWSKWQILLSFMLHLSWMMLARFLVPSDMYSSSSNMCFKPKKSSWEMQNLNLHNCKMNPFFLTHHLIRSLCIFIFQCFIYLFPFCNMNVEPKFFYPPRASRGETKIRKQTQTRKQAQTLVTSEPQTITIAKKSEL